MTDFPRILVEMEAEIVGDLRDQLDASFAAESPLAPPPPYRPGDRVLFRAHPADGIYLVTHCRAAAYGWRVDFEAIPVPGRSQMYGCCNAKDIVAVPDDWEPPPSRPLTPLEELQLSTDGEITATQRRTAAAQDESPEHQAKMRAYYRARANWRQRFVAPLLGGGQ